MQEPTITYCPAYPPSTVVSLVREASDDQPGVRAVAIAVSFPQDAPAGPPVEYRQVDSAAIDTDPG